MQILKHANTQIHRHTHKQTLKYTDAHTNKQTLKHTDTCTQTNTQTHTNKHIDTDMQTQTPKTRKQSHNYFTISAGTGFVRVRGYTLH